MGENWSYISTFFFFNVNGSFYSTLAFVYTLCPLNLSAVPHGIYSAHCNNCSLNKIGKAGSMKFNLGYFYREGVLEGVGFLVARNM